MNLPDQTVVDRYLLHDSPCPPLGACPGCGTPVAHYRGDFWRELSDALQYMPALHFSPPPCATALGVAPIFSSGHRVYFENFRLPLRFQYLLRGYWLMASLENRLGDAWRHKTIRYNLMLKDFEGAPRWYRALVGRFSDWRYDGS